MYFALPVLLATLLLIIIMVYKNRLLMVLLLSAFTLKVIVAYINDYVRTIGSAGDELRFELTAWEWAQNGFIDLFEKLGSLSSYGYSWFAAIIYTVVGREPFAVKSFGILASVLNVYYGYKISYFVFPNKRSAIVVSSIIAAIPSLTIMSALFLRDSLLIFLITLAFYHYLIWLEKRCINSLLVNIIILSLTAFLHGAMFIVIGFELFLETLRIVFSPAISTFQKAVGITIMSIIAAISVVFLQEIIANPKITMAISVIQQDPRAIARLGGELIKTEAFIAPYPAPAGTDAFSLLKHVPYRVFYFLSTPWPNMYQKATDLPRIFDSFIIIALMVLFVCRWSVVKKLFHTNVLLLIGALTVMFSFGSFDVGTGQRHRLKIIPLLIIVTFTAVNYKYYAKKNKTI